MGPNTMAEEDPFEHLRTSSPLHAAITSPNGDLILTPVLSGSKESLIAFQSVAEAALELATKRNRRVSWGASAQFDDDLGNKLCDHVIIYPD